MRKILFVLFIPFLLYSHPTKEGIKGFNNIISTSTDGAGHLDIIFDGYGSFGGKRDNDFWATADIGLGMGFSFTDWSSINLFSKYMADALDSTENNNYISHGMGDLEIGIKFTPSLLFKESEGGFDAGLYPFVSIPIGTKPKSTYPDTMLGSYIGQGGRYRFFTTGKTDWGAKLLLSYMSRTDIPIEIDVNFGYFTHYKDKERKADEWSYGVGVGFIYKNFIPYVELSGCEWKSDSLGPRVLYLTPGVKIGDKDAVSFNLSLNFRLSDIDKETIRDTNSYISRGEKSFPSWSFNLSYAQGFSFFKPPLPPPVISGIIIDAKTREPISAMLSIRDIEVEIDSTGNYLLKVEPGSFIVRAKKEGYLTADRNVTIAPGQEVFITFELEKVHKPRAEMAGKVLDRVDEIPVVAEISFPQTDIEPFFTDETGVFKIEISPGTYIVKISAEGYVPYAIPVSLKDGETLLKDFYILKEHTKITLKGINFATASAKIEPVYYSILGEGLELLEEYPNIKVEIGGHTDSIGSAESNLKLSQERAESVMNYFISKGIDSKRLRAVGYGESMPVADNGTEEGRALNRRIEFYVIGE